LHQQQEKHDLQLLTDGKLERQADQWRPGSVQHVGETCEWRRQVWWWCSAWHVSVAVTSVWPVRTAHKSVLLTVNIVSHNPAQSSSDNIPS